MRRIILFFLIVSFFSSNSHAIIPFGRIIHPNGNWNHNGNGISNVNQYSLQWDEETCRTRIGHDIGYVKTESMNPDNPEGSFNPGINTIHGFHSWVLFLGHTCMTWHGGPTFTTVVPDTNKAFCKSLGLMNAERTCFTTRKAPSSKRELYIWLADIDYSLGGKDSQDDPHLQKVRGGDADAINAGYKTFKNIKMKWVRDIKLDTDDDVLKKYISQFPGQNMICARARGTFTSGSNPACSDPDKCLSPDSLHLLIKCLAVPMGPPPHPFTPFIVGKENIYSVPVHGMIYSNPKARIVYFVRGIKNALDIDTLSNGVNNVSKDKYTFEIKVSGTEICSFLKEISGKPLGAPYPLGCQYRGIEPNPNITSIPPLSGSTKKLAGQISYPWLPPLAKLQPTSSVEMKNPTALRDGTDVYVSDNGVSSVFQGGFNRNPEKRRIDLSSSRKKMCSVNAASPIVEFIEINQSCSSVPSLIKNRNINIYKCTNGVSDPSEEITMFVGNQNDCIREGLDIASHTPELGNQCHDDSFVPVSKTCGDISESLFYEHDDDGQKLCIRNWSSSERKYIIMRKNQLDPSKLDVIPISEAGYALMPLDTDGNINFSGTFTSFNNFQQGELDYFRKVSDTNYWYKNPNNGMDITYKHGPRVSKVGNIETTYIDNNGQPFIVQSDDIMYEGDPSQQGLCTDAIISDTSAKTWSYTLQMPGYYTNYKDSDFNNDTELKSIESSLKKIPGMIQISSNTVQDQTKFDEIKKSTLLIPTKFSNGAQGVDTGIIGIANDTANREIKFDNFHTSIKSNYKFKSFNFYNDYFQETRRNNKILYSNGKDLTKDPSSDDMSNNLFDTSQCNLIEFEIWGGGGQSRSNPLGGAQDFRAKNFVDDVNDNLQNNASAGQNGMYVRGRFRIRKNSLIKVKVSDATGKISTTPGLTAESTNNLNDFSSIWITDFIDKNLQLIKTESGSEKHECQTNSDCSKLTNGNYSGLPVTLDNNTETTVMLPYIFGSSDLLHSYEKKPNLDQNIIQIEAYRGLTMSNFSGINKVRGKDELISTLPISSPISVNRYEADDSNAEYGYKIVKNMLNLTKATGMTDWKDNGSGNFNEIGSYMYLNFKDTEGYFNYGLNIDWSRRSRYFNPKICESRLRACYEIGVDSTITASTKLIQDGDASSIIGESNPLKNILLLNALTPEQINNLVTDVNLYCPGMGGCYYNNRNNAISQSGTAGLVKIKCLKI